MSAHHLTFSRMSILLKLIVCFFALLIVNDLQAQSDPFSLLRPAYTPFELKANASIFPDSEVKSPLVGSVSFSQAEVKGRWVQTPKEVGSLAIGFRYEHFDISSPVAVLPDHMDFFEIGMASELYSTDLWTFYGAAGLGYSSVHTPFGDGEGIFATAFFSARREIDDKAHLSVYLYYDGNRSFMPDVPLPGFSYERKIHDKVTLILGFPFVMVRWTPTPKHMLNLMIADLNAYSLYYRFGITDTFSYYATAKAETKSFHTDISVDNRRIFYRSHFVESGFNYRIGPATAQLAGGFAFNRDFEIGFDTRNSRLFAELENEPYLKLGLTARF